MPAGRLRGVRQRPLDPVPSPAGAPRRHATPARGSFGRAATALGLAAVVIGVVTLRQGATVPEAAAARESLIAEVTRTTATVDDLRRQVATLTTQDDAAAAAALTVDQDGASLQARINALAALAAESSATGKGPRPHRDRHAGAGGRGADRHHRAGRARSDHRP